MEIRPPPTRNMIRIKMDTHLGNINMTSHIREDFFRNKKRNNFMSSTVKQQPKRELNITRVSSTTDPEVRAS